MRRKHVVECSEHPCSTLPCDNQGSCSADDQGFVCTCKNNFAGKTFFEGFFESCATVLKPVYNRSCSGLSYFL